MNKLHVVSSKQKMIDYEAIASSQEFKELLREKSRFIVVYTILYIGYAMLLPILAFYTDILKNKVFGDITWAWIYGVSIIVMSWVVCSIYVKKSAVYDKRMKEIVERGGIY